MTKQEICSKIKEVLYSINVYQDGELVSQGSGVSINENGDLLTAAHVISGSLPVRKKDIRNLEIHCKKHNGTLEKYGLVACGFSLPFEWLKEPLTVDLSVLKRLDTISNREFLKINTSLPNIGQDVIFSGFSDEVFSLFTIEDKINFDHDIFQGKGNLIENKVAEFLNFEIYKSGMIGRAYPITFTEGSSNIKLSAYEMYLDNGIHSGASGGPVVNMKGELIGIITQRAMSSISTSQNPGLKVPSGSTIAFSASTLLDYIDKQTQKEVLSIPWYKT